MLLPLTALAEPLYLERVQQAAPEAKAIAEARKQIEEHKPVEPRALDLKPYHQQAALPQTAKQPLCALCHAQLPHRKNERSRGFLNMHARTLACETCHLRPKDARLDYRWLAYDGPQAGALVEPPVPAVVEKDAIPPLGAPGLRIAPVHGGEPALILSDHALGADIERRWKDLPLDDKAQLKARLHAPLEKQGPACRDCHGREPFIDFAALGASAQQRRALQDNPVAQFFARFKDKDQRLRLTDLLR